jgi:inner membrane protein import complex subunit Tim44-like protein
MGLLGRLLGREPDADRRGADVAARLEALSQLDPKWSTEALRRRVRDVFFAVERSWIERDPSVGEPFMAAQLQASQRLRIEGLVRQHRVHQLENPLIEDLDFVAVQESPPRVTALLDMSLVETILDDASGALVAGQAGVKVRRRQFWTFDWDGGAWALADVEQPDAGARHLNAPLVGGDFASLSPEMILRERYARGEISLEDFERDMTGLLQREPTN